MKKLLSLLLTLILLCSTLVTGAAQAAAAEEMLCAFWKDICEAKDAPLISAALELEDPAQNVQLLFCRGDENLSDQPLQSSIILSDGETTTGIPALALVQAFLSELGFDMLPDLTQGEAELLGDIFTQIAAGISPEAISMSSESAEDGSETKVHIAVHTARLLEEVNRLAIDVLNDRSGEIDALLLRHEAWIHHMFGLEAEQEQSGSDETADSAHLPSGTALPEVPIPEITSAYLARQLQDLNLPGILGEDIPIEIQLTHGGHITRDWQFRLSAGDMDFHLNFSGGHLNFTASIPGMDALYFDTRDLEKLMNLLNEVPDYITSDAFEFIITSPDDFLSSDPYEAEAQPAPAPCTQAYPAALRFRLDSEKLIRCLADGLIHSLQRNREDFAQLIDEYRPWLKLWDEELAMLVSPEMLIICLNQLRRISDARYYRTSLSDSIQISLDINDPRSKASPESNALVLNAAIWGWKADVQFSPASSSILIRDLLGRNVFTLNGKHTQSSGTFEIRLPYSNPISLQYARTGSDGISIWLDSARGMHARLIVSADGAELEYNDGYDLITGSAEWTDGKLHAQFSDEEEVLCKLDAAISDGVLVIDASADENNNVLRLVYDGESLFARYDDPYSYMQLDMIFLEESCDITLDLDGSTYRAAIGRINGVDRLRISSPTLNFSLSQSRLHDGYEYSAGILTHGLRFDVCLSLRENAFGLDWYSYSRSNYADLEFELKLNPHGALPGLFAQLDFNGSHSTIEYAPGRLALENSYTMLVFKDTSAKYAPNCSEITISGYDIHPSVHEPGVDVLYTYRLGIESEDQCYRFILSDDSGKLGSLALDFSPEPGDILPQEINWISARDLADSFQ